MTPIDRLLDILERLRDPATGCPWDREQTFQTIAPYTLEEAYEVVDAIERGDWQALKDELGDLLLQVVYHAQIASEQGMFGFDEVVGAVSAKMVARHPHVFGEDRVGDAAELSRRWDQDKEQARLRRGRHGVFDDIARNLPALRLAQKLQGRAARKGFDWKETTGVFEKLNEETDELRTAMESSDGVAREVGDLLFTVVNLARRLSVDSESALREASRKFETRVCAVESKLRAQGRSWQDAGFEELDELWEEVKREEPRAGPPACR